MILTSVTLFSINKPEEKETLHYLREFFSDLVDVGPLLANDVAMQPHWGDDLFRHLRVRFLVHGVKGWGDEAQG